MLRANYGGSAAAICSKGPKGQYAFILQNRKAGSECRLVILPGHLAMWRKRHGGHALTLQSGQGPVSVSGQDWYFIPNRNFTKLTRIVRNCNIPSAHLQLDPAFHFRRDNDARD